MLIRGSCSFPGITFHEWRPQWCSHVERQTRPCLDLQQNKWKFCPQTATTFCRTLSFWSRSSFGYSNHINTGYQAILQESRREIIWIKPTCENLWEFSDKVVVEANTPCHKHLQSSTELRLNICDNLTTSLGVHSWRLKSIGQPLPSLKHQVQTGVGIYLFLSVSTFASSKAQEKHVIH